MIKYLLLTVATIALAGNPGLNKKTLQTLEQQVAALLGGLDATGIETQQNAETALRELGPSITLTPAYQQAKLNGSAQVKQRIASLDSVFTPRLTASQLVESLAKDAVQSDYYKNSVEGLRAVVRGLSPGDRRELRKFERTDSMDAPLDPTALKTAGQIVEASIRSAKVFTVDGLDNTQATPLIRVHRGSDRYVLRLNGTGALTLRWNAEDAGQPRTMVLDWKNKLESHKKSLGFAYPASALTLLDSPAPTANATLGMGLTHRLGTQTIEVSVQTAQGTTYPGLTAGISAALYGAQGGKTAEVLEPEGGSLFREVPLL